LNIKTLPAFANRRSLRRVLAAAALCVALPAFALDHGYAAYSAVLQTCVAAGRVDYASVKTNSAACADFSNGSTRKNINFTFAFLFQNIAATRSVLNVTAAD
jgi:hypothetical protein